MAALRAATRRSISWRSPLRLAGSLEPACWRCLIEHPGRAALTEGDSAPSGPCDGRALRHLAAARHIGYGGVAVASRMQPEYGRARSEGWPSGSRRTPGERVGALPLVGSNPTPSAMTIGLLRFSARNRISTYGMNYRTARQPRFIQLVSCPRITEHAAGIQAVGGPGGNSARWWALDASHRPGGDRSKAGRCASRSGLAVVADRTPPALPHGAGPCRPGRDFPIVPGADPARGVPAAD